MPSGFFLGFDVCERDGDGKLIPLANETVSVYDVTNSTALSDLETDDYGVIPTQESEATADVILEFSVDGYTPVLRRTTATSAETVTGFESTLLVDDSFSEAEGASGIVDVEVWLTNEDNPDYQPKLLGRVLPDTVNEFTHNPALDGENIKLYLIARNEKNVPDVLGLNEAVQTEFATIPPYHPTTHIASLVAYSETPISGLADNDPAPAPNWNDATGNGNHIVQATGGLRGTYKTNQIGGQAVIQFPWGKYAAIPDNASLDVNHFTLFGVARIDSNANTYKVIVMKAHPTSWNDGYGIVTDLPLRIYAFVGDGVTDVVTHTVTEDVGFAFALRFDGVNVDLWVDGGSVGTNPRTADTPTNSYDLQIGNSSYQSDSSFGALGLCNAALDDTALGELFSYLTDKFGL